MGRQGDPKREPGNGLEITFETRHFAFRTYSSLVLASNKYICRKQKQSWLPSFSNFFCLFIFSFSISCYPFVAFLIFENEKSISQGSAQILIRNWKLNQPFQMCFYSELSQTADLGMWGTRTTISMIKKTGMINRGWVKHLCQGLWGQTNHIILDGRNDIHISYGAVALGR